MAHVQYENIDPAKHTVKLPEEQFLQFQEAVALEGPPRILRDQDRPNAALRLMWDFRKEHGFPLRYTTIIGDDGIMRYKLAIR